MGDAIGGLRLCARLGGIQAKGTEIICILTTNHIDRIP
jgi:hypothetical protein